MNRPHDPGDETTVGATRPPSDDALYRQAGGEPVLRAVIAEFYERVFADAMIGFHFQGTDKQRLIDKELELALGILGASVPYTGQPLRAAHAKHRIFGGQFMRRLQILREVMAEHGLPEEVQTTWVEHTMRLMPQITADAPTECRMPEDEQD